MAERYLLAERADSSSKAERLPRPMRVAAGLALAGLSLTSVSAAERPLPDDCELHIAYDVNKKQVDILYDDDRAIGKLAFYAHDNQRFHVEYLQYDNGNEPQVGDMLLPSFGNKHRFVEADAAEMSVRDVVLQRDDEQGSVIIDIDPLSQTYQSSCED